MINNRIPLLAALLALGIILSISGNALMDMEKPVRQGSSLLENYLIMQSMAGKNPSYVNQTYVIGDSGIVVSFNDIVSNKQSQIQGGTGVVNATTPLSVRKQVFSNITSP
jgi:hypothetical protein